MKEYIIYIISSKGTHIGLGVAILKTLQAIREGMFNWRQFLTMFPSTILMSYIGYEIALSAELAIYLVYLFSLFMGLNAFLIITTLQSKDILIKIGESFLKKK